MAAQRVLRLALWMSLSIGLSLGCAQSGSDGGLVETGEVQVSLTDAASDEIDRFEVDVLSIDLVKANGAEVAALPLTTRVDFADLVDVAEILTAASVPRGVYVAANVALDFSTAEVHLAGADDNAAVFDENGDPLQGTIDVMVQLDGGRPLIVLPGTPRMLTLDFDLDASVTVDAGSNSVEVTPVLVADVDLERPHVHRVRGPLESVDVAAGTCRIAVRPFRALVSVFGHLTVATDGDTHFEIDGERYVGAQGLMVLDEQPSFAAVVAIGAFDLGRRVFVATEVHVGASVPGGVLDVAQGLVTARSGDTLLLRGAQLDRAGGSVTFHAEIAVDLDPERTRVTKQFSADSLDIDAISVGQRIVVFGSLAVGSEDFVIETADWVRLVRTEVIGTVAATGEGSLTVDVRRIGRRLVRAFDFQGTGAEGDDANPASYRVDTGALSLEGLSAGAPVRVLGFASPFGSAPPDFEAQTIVDVSAVGALMRVAWGFLSTVQFEALDASRIDLDLSESPLLHHVDRAGTLTDLTEAPAAAVVPAASRGFYVVAGGGTITLFGEFDAFAAELESRLAAGRFARRLTALGHYSDATGVLSAGVVTVILTP